MLRKPKPGERMGPTELPFEDAEFIKAYPTVHEYLTAVLWGDNSSRVTSTLLVFVENGVLRICLNDRDNNQSAFFTGDTFEGALLSLEHALLSERVEWRRRNNNYTAGGKPPF